MFSLHNEGHRDFLILSNPFPFCRDAKHRVDEETILTFEA